MIDPADTLAASAAAPPPSQAAAHRPHAVSLSGLVFTWPGRPRFTLRVEEFAAAQGERILLIGPSGGGKSTLLSLLAGIVSPQAGRIEILGTDIAALSGPARDRFRAEHFGIIFQMFNLLPYGSVVDNVLLPLSFSARRRSAVTARGAPSGEARRLLERLGLPVDALAGNAAARLSVGQQQRVAAARALIGAPEIVIADEPTSALDARSQDDFLTLLFDETEAAGATLLMVSHDERLAPRFGRVLRLDDIASVERSPR